MKRYFVVQYNKLSKWIKLELFVIQMDQRNYTGFYVICNVNRRMSDFILLRMFSNTRDGDEQRIRSRPN